MLYIAHRGASHYAPENTAAAFGLALEMGAKAVELDVHLSSDGVLVVHHDYDLKRTAGVDVKIGEHGFAELKKHNIAAHFSGWKGVEHVLSLEQALEILGPDIMLNVEIKNDGGIYRGMEKEVLRVCAARGERTIFSSFDHDTLRRLRELDSCAHIGVLVNGMDFDSAFSAAAGLKAESLNFSLRKLTPEVTHLAKDAGLHTLIYTVNTASEATRAKECGACGVFTNRPDLEKEAA